MFEGFRPETVDFLWGIRLNNNREWFLEHKKDYVDHLYEPMKALGKELFQPFIERPGDLLKVSRIYRDARMHHPLPYKESLWICIRKDVEWWAEHPCLYFEITPDGISYGFIWLQPKVQALKAMRQAIAAQPRKFLNMVNKAEKETGTAITAKTYKRPPDKSPSKALERFFGWKGYIACTVDEEFSEKTFGPQLAGRVREYLEKLIPLYEFLNQFSA